MNKAEASGVVILDKPVGPTSHDVVARVRKHFGQRSVGHAGTLDPFASGVLVVALGEGTKLVPYLTQAEKAYSATLVLGATTPTFDPTEPVSERAALAPSLVTELHEGRGPLLEAAFALERSRTHQVPPMHSAIHVGGTRAYALARQGTHVDLPERPVSVKALSLDTCGIHTHDGTASLTFSVVVSKGYYVRALARDLAAALGTVGHLTMLRRTAAVPFTVEEAEPLASARVLEMAEVARRILPAVTLTEKGTIDARMGRAIAETDRFPHVSEPAAWFSAEGELVAIGEGDRVLRGFRPTSSSPES
ncbi:MAG: tRNA pseudouridine(55) synthase TruB [Polyangiaceae bacterium]